VFTELADFDQRKDRKCYECFEGFNELTTCSPLSLLTHETAIQKGRLAEDG
jgi:hypothetical protein